jgi:hypothetical protein
VNDWSAVFLAVIALATFTMAAIQVGAIIYAGRLSKRIERVISRLEGDVQPLLGRLTTVTADVARATSLAVAQMERLDKLGADFTRRAEDTIVEVQQAIVTPARESLAVLTGLRAAIAALTGRRAGRPVRAGAHEEEDPLFIG